jgi:hypothetical protein
MPITLVSGRLNTLNADTCPILRFIPSEAGIIHHRLNDGCSIGDGIDSGTVWTAMIPCALVDFCRSKRRLWADDRSFDRLRVRLIRN